jgi:SRSO17 transposase
LSEKSRFRIVPGPPAPPIARWEPEAAGPRSEVERLVALAKLRWRVGQDYRELKGALGLDHFEGRSSPGWHHHVTLVSVAHGFLTCERLRRPPARAAA